jgi:acyl-CoA reductase-like NAD-dependent aldehyde dehydrogenase
MSVDWISRAQALTLRVRNYSSGQWSECGGDLLEKRSPRDGQSLYRFGAGDSREVDEAVACARRAFDDGRWSAQPIQRRKDVLHALAALITKNCDELALLECLDVGKPISAAREVDLPVAAAIIKFNAEAADKFYGKVCAADRSSLSYQLQRPVGVVAGIVGWNFPLVLAAGKIGPALAAGNSLVLKPSELTSLSTARIAELAVQAGVPEGVLNVIHGGATVGAALALHSDVNLITFTGSTQTGKKLLIAAGQSNMKRLLLECGGKAANIVFDDCPNYEAVADAVVARAFWNQGQVCTASSRLLIQDGIKEKIVPLIIKKAAELGPGDPLREETRFGAVVSLGHQQKVLSYIRKGEQEGARMIYRSNAQSPFEGGSYVSPVIFDDVHPEQTIAREEIFGPVLSIITFRDEEEAIKIANSTVYGLSVILWTRDLGRAHRVTQGIKSGWIVVNATEKTTGGPSLGVLPVGGHKESGIGLEGGIEGLEEYTSKTTVQIFV